MRIGEYWADEEKPSIDGDWIRNVLVLGRNSVNPADTDGGRRGASKITRKFNLICESQALYSKFDKAPAHIGPHKFDGSYKADDLMGTWHNPVSSTKGLRMDILCRKIGESYHPQAIALRDHIQHDRAFGGFSPLFDGETNMATGEVQTVDNVCSIDWVPQPGSSKSIAEAASEPNTYEARHEEHERRLDDHETRIAECEARMGERIAEAVAIAMTKKAEEESAKKIAESVAEKHNGSAGTGSIPATPPAVQSPVDPFKFIRGK